jgi:hypothetical protein
MHALVRLCLLGLGFQSVIASSLTSPQTTLYQMFWQPQFHGERLGYCNETKSCCGQKIANQYCLLLGFEMANRFKEAKNLGLTNFLSGKNQCQGWKCSGFEWIECKGHRTYVARPLSDYEQELFVRPRWRKFPLAWCYDSGKQACGEKSAYAFCRWQGYGGVQSYSKPMTVYASKKIGSNSLCIGSDCRGFEYIICKRT